MTTTCWLYGFANADGGTLIISRNDEGVAVGAPDAERLLVDLPNKIRDTLGIIPPVRAVDAKARCSSRSKSSHLPRPSATGANTTSARAAQKQHLTGNALSAFLLRKLGRHWDNAPVPGVGIRDLSPIAFKRFKEHAKGGDRLPPRALSASRAELVERLRLTEAGMLNAQPSCCSTKTPNVGSPARM